ncbi:MAG: hypothetical protein QMB94_10965 [Phycisphaerales bacterium]
MVRMLSSDRSLGRIEVAYSDIAKIQFAGRDPAVGKTCKTWENWVRRFAEKKRISSVIAATDQRGEIARQLLDAPSYR